MRYRNLSTPFWVDEFSTASQALIYIHNDPSLGSIIEKNNFTTNFITSISFRLFEVSTSSARYPALLFGSLVPVFLFILARNFFSTKVALFSSLLAIFSYFQITWSRQARGYALQQLLVLMALTAYYNYLAKKKLSYLILLILILSIGLATHLSFILIIISLCIHFGLINRSSIFSFLKEIKGTTSRVLLVALIIGIIALIYKSSLPFTSQLSLTNNISYYHSFLWREQTIISFLAIVGICFTVFKRNKKYIATLILILLATYLIFFSFVFPPYVSRYLLPIFPLLILCAGIAIFEISNSINPKKALLIGLLLTIGIVLNGDTFTLKPKQFYSVNNDMREIALIDYDQVYQVIKTKGEFDAGNTAVIDTWTDRTRWYLGTNKEYYYNFRWANETGLVNGLPKNTPYKMDDNKEKLVLNSGNPPVKLIAELSDLESAMKKYPKGFIWIDDASLPKDVIEYAENNLTKELYLDHFPLDSNPYSIWPGTLYSWGIES